MSRSASVEPAAPAGRAARPRPRAEDRRPPARVALGDPVVALGLVGHRRIVPRRAIIAPSRHTTVPRVVQSLTADPRLPAPAARRTPIWTDPSRAACWPAASRSACSPSSSSTAAASASTSSRRRRDPRGRLAAPPSRSGARSARRLAPGDRARAGRVRGRPRRSVPGAARHARCDALFLGASIAAILGSAGHPPVGVGRSRRWPPGPWKASGRARRVPSGVPAPAPGRRDRDARPGAAGAASAAASCWASRSPSSSRCCSRRPTRSSGAGCRRPARLAHRPRRRCSGGLLFIAGLSRGSSAGLLSRRDERHPGTSSAPRSAPRHARPAAVPAGDPGRDRGDHRPRRDRPRRRPFVGLQVAYLFGGLDTLVAAGMTYSDYARRGFFELVAAACLAGGGGRGARDDGRAAEPAVSRGAASGSSA